MWNGSKALILGTLQYGQLNHLATNSLQPIASSISYDAGDNGLIHNSVWKSKIVM